VNVVVAVPVKDLANAKQRLVPVLTAAERVDLARAMLGDVLRSLAAARVDALWVVTREAEVAALARAGGAEVLREAENHGHTAAVAFAQAEARRRGVRTFLTIPGDVPCLRPEEVDALVAATMEPRAAAFAPSRSGLGTNGAALAPPDVMPLTFGEPSFDNHLATARRHGLQPRVLTLPGLSLDIDGPDDLRALLIHGRHTRSGDLVADWFADRSGRRAAAPGGHASPVAPSH
jgi:2-phospho-L-lactate guanylyltransferase